VPYQIRSAPFIVDGCGSFGRVFLLKIPYGIFQKQAFYLCHWLIHAAPPRRSYDDRQRAAKMKEIGLQPVTTGEPGGKETGQSVTYYILPRGLQARDDAGRLSRIGRDVFSEAAYAAASSGTAAELRWPARRLMIELATMS
jgi:hypothetical protein